MYRFVIDTDQYAGNFYRQMCAFITGQLDELGIGEEFLELVPDEAKKRLGPIVQRCEIKNNYTPAEIYPTPGWFNNGLGGEFRDGQEVEALEEHKKYCIKLSNQKPYEIESANQEYKEKWMKESNRQLRKHPAYMSVAIFFSERPAYDTIEFMKRRAHSFIALKKSRPDLWRFLPDIKIEGFRLVWEETREEHI